MADAQPIHLFSFGTLPRPDVHEALFGGPTPSRPATLPGHGLTQVPITNPEVICLSGVTVHRSLPRFVQESAEGCMLTLTTDGLTSSAAPSCSVCG